MRRGGSGCASKLCGGPECDCGSYLQDNFEPLLRLLSAAVPGPVHHYAFCVNHGNCGALFRPESSHFADLTTNITTCIITSTCPLASSLFLLRLRHRCRVMGTGILRVSNFREGRASTQAALSIFLQ